jgi:hypothetical protein
MPNRKIRDMPQLGALESVACFTPSYPLPTDFGIFDDESAIRMALICGLHNMDLNLPFT